MDEDEQKYRDNVRNEFKFCRNYFGIITLLYFIVGVFFIVIRRPEPLLAFATLALTVYYFNIMMVCQYYMHNTQVFARDPDLKYQERPVNRIHQYLMENRVWGHLVKADHKISYDNFKIDEVIIKKNIKGDATPFVVCFFIFIGSPIGLGMIVIGADPLAVLGFSIIFNGVFPLLPLYGETQTPRFIGYAKDHFLFEYPMKLRVISIDKIMKIEKRGRGKYIFDHFILDDGSTVSMEYVDDDQEKEMKGYYFDRKKDRKKITVSTNKKSPKSLLESQS